MEICSTVGSEGGVCVCEREISVTNRQLWNSPSEDTETTTNFTPFLSESYHFDVAFPSEQHLRTNGRRVVGTILIGEDS